MQKIDPSRLKKGDLVTMLDFGSSNLPSYFLGHNLDPKLLPLSTDVRVIEFTVEKTFEVQKQYVLKEEMVIDESYEPPE